MREIWGEFKNPWGGAGGAQAALFARCSSFSLGTNSDCNIYANAVNEIKAIVVPIRLILYKPLNTFSYNVFRLPRVRS